MHLKTITDQAFRCVLYLSGCQRPRSTETISKETVVPEKSVKKIMSVLCKNDIVNRHCGKTRGYTLAKSPEKIFMYDIVALFQDSCKISCCLGDDGYCNREGIQADCPVKKILIDVQQQMNQRFKQVTFLELYEQTVAYKEKSAKLISL